MKGQSRIAIALVVAAAIVTILLLVRALRESFRPSSIGPNPGSIAGLGATSADWDAAHRQVRTQPNGQSYPPGTIYDPQPDGSNRFVAVARANGRITAFTMRFSAGGVQAEAAVQAVLPFIPPDAQLQFDDVREECEVLGFQSQRLGRALGSASEVGYIRIELTSAESDGAYDSNHVQFATVIGSISSDILNQSLAC